MITHSKIRTFSHSRTGFSTLMAIGTIAVLLIIVVGLASTYIREMRLARTSYDEVLAYANAEGMFEYAMLKVRNHREGFADIVTNSELDGKILVPTTERSKGMQSSYTIEANSTDHTAQLEPNNHLILPLFASLGSPLSGASKDPKPEPLVTKVQNLEVSLGGLSWTIVAMSGSESVGLTGSGDISSAKSGIIRHKASQCYRYDGIKIDPQDGICKPELIHENYNSLLGTYTSTGEELQYFYDEPISVPTFLSSTTDPYLMVFNDQSGAHPIHITSLTPFALPTLSVRAEAHKNDSTQVFQFTEDKSKYYDALKYGVYNTD